MARSLGHMGRKMLTVLIVLAMLMPLVPVVSLPVVDAVSEVQANTTLTVNIGDYIQFGKYNDAPILWRVIHKEADGNPILISDRILTLKAFVAAGDYQTNNYHKLYGSNYYKDSNIRQRLKSSSTNIVTELINRTQKQPSNTNV